MNAPKIVRQNENVRVVVRTTAELFEEGKDDKEKYVGGKWGGLYLRAPDIYFRILEKAGDKLVQLGDVAEVLGYIHDNSTGPRFPSALFLKSIKNVDSIRLTDSSPGVYLYGVRDDGNSRIKAPILIARTFGDRLLAVWNQGHVLAKEFYKVITRSHIEQTVAALINSTMTLLAMELQGHTNLGGGGLKHSIATIRRILIADPSKVDFEVHRNLFSAFQHLVIRPVRSIFEELGFSLCATRRCSHPEHPYEHAHPEKLTLEQVQKASPDRFELDRVVFDVLGLTDEERLEVYRAVARLVKDRLTKARSNSNGG